MVTVGNVYVELAFMTSHNASETAISENTSDKSLNMYANVVYAAVAS